MAGMKEYLTRVAVALDQFVNTLCGGHPDETFSASCWRKQDKSWYWKVLRMTVDGIFFWQSGHCERAYVSEINNSHLPGIYRERN